MFGPLVSIYEICLHRVERSQALVSAASCMVFAFVSSIANQGNDNGHQAEVSFLEFCVISWISLMYVMKMCILLRGSPQQFQNVHRNENVHQAEVTTPMLQVVKF